MLQVARTKPDSEKRMAFLKAWSTYQRVYYVCKKFEVLDLFGLPQQPIPCWWLEDDVSSDSGMDAGTVALQAFINQDHATLNAVWSEVHRVWRAFTLSLSAVKELDDDSLVDPDLVGNELFRQPDTTIRYSQSSA